MEETFLSWCKAGLSKALGSPVEDALLDYLVSMKVERDAREYLLDLLSDSNLDTTQVDAFMKEFFRQWCPPPTVETKPPSNQEQLARPTRDELVLKVELMMEGECRDGLPYTAKTVCKGKVT
jgi:hypothetical protein